MSTTPAAPPAAAPIEKSLGHWTTGKGVARRTVEIAVCRHCTDGIITRPLAGGLWGHKVTGEAACRPVGLRVCWCSADRIDRCADCTSVHGGGPPFPAQP